MPSIEQTVAKGAIFVLPAGAIIDSGQEKEIPPHCCFLPKIGLHSFTLTNGMQQYDRARIRFIVVDPIPDSLYISGLEIELIGIEGTGTGLDTEIVFDSRIALFGGQPGNLIEKAILLLLQIQLAPDAALWIVFEDDRLPGPVESVGTVTYREIGVSGLLMVPKHRKPPCVSF